MKLNTHNTPLITSWSHLNFNGFQTKIGNISLPTNSNGVLTLTDGGGCESRVATFDKQKINPTVNWTLNYTYTGSIYGAEAYIADGIAMIIHNDSRKLDAIGGLGHSIGYRGGVDNYCGDLDYSYTKISPSIDFEMNILKGKVYLNTNGADIADEDYTTPGTITLSSGSPVNVAMQYNGATKLLTVRMTQGAVTWFTTYPSIDFTGWKGGGTSAYLAFTGGTGQYTSTQTITNVYFRGSKEK